jgi:hypothetical protein
LVIASGPDESAAQREAQLVYLLLVFKAPARIDVVAIYVTIPSWSINVHYRGILDPWKHMRPSGGFGIVKHSAIETEALHNRCGKIARSISLNSKIMPLVVVLQYMLLCAISHGFAALSFCSTCVTSS